MTAISGRGSLRGPRYLIDLPVGDAGTDAKAGGPAGMDASCPRGLRRACGHCNAKVLVGRTSPTVGRRSSVRLDGPTEYNFYFTLNIGMRFAPDGSFCIRNGKTISICTRRFPSYQVSRMKVNLFCNLKCANHFCSKLTMKKKSTAKSKYRVGNMLQGSL